MKLSKAIEIFNMARIAEGYSANTLAYYKLYLQRLCDFLNNPDLANIQRTDLQHYFAWLRTDYKPVRSSGDTSPLKEISLSQHWGALRSFFGWAADELGISRPDENLNAPRFSSAVIIPYSKYDIAQILKAMKCTTLAKTGKPSE
jgi:site-specific recombinase XerD